MFLPRKRLAFRLGVAGLLGAALVLAAGCGKSKGTVNGKVTLKDGTPVSAGTVTFWTKDNHSYPAKLKDDGTYSAVDIPTGDMKVTVEGPPPRMGPAGAGMGKPPEGSKGMPPEMIPKGEGDPSNPGTLKVVPIPPKYKTFEGTPLTYTVVSGTQIKDFPLEP
jgi:hypothetical protein